MTIPACEHCGTIRMPGSPWCTKCFTPYEEDPPAVVAPVGEPVGVSAAYTPPANVPDFGYAVSAVPSAPAPPPGAPLGWRPPSAVAPNLLPSGGSPRRVPIKQIAFFTMIAVLLTMGVGGYVWYKKTPRGPKAAIAEAFRSGRPPAFIPSMPDFTSPLADLDDRVEQPGEAAAYVTSLDPELRAMNARLVSLQNTLASWARGKTGDDTVRAELEELAGVLKPLESIREQLQAPKSLQRGLNKLSSAVTSYDMALSSLLDWMDSGSDGARTAYHLSVRQANVSWDEGLMSVYRAGGRPAPELPHPQKKD